MTSTWVYEDMLDRIAAMQKEAVTELNSDLPVAIGPAFHGTLPSVQNYLEDLIDFSSAENQWKETRQVRMFVQIGESDEGFDEEVARIAVRYLQLITIYFQKNTRLTTSAAGDYPTEPTYLDVIGTSLVNDPGVRAYQAGGIASTRIGMAMILHVPIFVQRGLSL